MAPRANWKGWLKIDAFSCPVALYSAVSTSERIAFHILNRATGHRVRREFVDSGNGEPVPADDQVKGYQVAEGDYVLLEAEETASATPESDKTLTIAGFVPIDDVNEIYLQRPYYLGPSERSADERFAVFREALAKKNVAAIAHAVLFRRVHTLLLRASGSGVIATTLNYDWEVRPADQAFEDVPAITIKGEMLQLAEHIIRTKAGAFDPSRFEDRYEKALAALVEAKVEGKPLPKPKAPKTARAADLLSALRRSLDVASHGEAAPPKTKSRARSSGVRGRAAKPVRRAS